MGGFAGDEEKWGKEGYGGVEAFLRLVGGARGSQPQQVRDRPGPRHQETVIALT